MPERDDLDRLIDSELASYAEPRPGLEQRILRRVEDQRKPHRGVFNRWQSWLLAGVVVAIALLLMIPRQRTMHRETNLDIAHSTSPNLPPVRRNEIPPPQIEGPHFQGTVKPIHNAAHIPKSIRLEAIRQPKLDVFPAPQPLSQQEQSLVRLATQLPDAEREKLLSDQKNLNAPIEISAIRIPPIAMPGQGKN